MRIHNAVLVYFNHFSSVSVHFALPEGSPATATGEVHCDANITGRGGKRIGGVPKARIASLVHDRGVSDIIAADFDFVLIISRRTEVPVYGSISQRMAGSQIHPPPLGIVAVARAPPGGEAAVVAICSTVAVLSRTCRDWLSLR